MNSVVIVVHNVPSRSTEILSMTDECLRTLRDTADEDYELVLVDNGSQDYPKTVDHLGGFVTSMGMPAGRCHVVCYLDNRPIASCWNDSIKNHCQGDVIVLLNNDVVFNRPGWLSLLSRAAKQPNVGCAGSKMMGWNGFTFLEGAFLAFRKDIVEKVLAPDIFDTRFLFTCEEVDFCVRLEQAGYRLVETRLEDAGYAKHLHHGTLSWSNEEGGWNGRSILEVMHESRKLLCRKYGKSDRVND